MSGSVQTRSYQFRGLNLRIFCPEVITDLLDARFQLLPSEEAWREQAVFEFSRDPGQCKHRVEMPSGRSRAFYEIPDGEGLYYESDDLLYLSKGTTLRAICHPGLGRASFSLLEMDDSTLWLATRLFLTIFLVEILKRRGRCSLHAAGVSENEQGVFIAGSSGAGKSTLTIALLRAGFSYMSDDMLFLTRDFNGLRVTGFPEPVDITDETAALFPELRSLVPASPHHRWPKMQVLPREMYGAEITAEVRSGVLVFPRISDKQLSQIVPIDSNEALLELASNVLLIEKRSCQLHLDLLAGLISTMPCYRLETGRDFDCIPDMVREVLCVNARPAGGMIARAV